MPRPEDKNRKCGDDSTEDWLKLKWKDLHYKGKHPAFKAGREMAHSLEAPSGSDSMPPQSKFTQIEDLVRYGWVYELDPNHEPLKEKDFGSLERALQACGSSLTTRSEYWHKVCLTHSRDSVDQIHKSTGAYYKSLVNFEDGIWIALEQRGPAQARQDNKVASPSKGKRAANPVEPALPLRHLSDVLFLGLLRAARDLKARELDAQTPKSPKSSKSPRSKAKAKAKALDDKLLPLAIESLKKIQHVFVGNFGENDDLQVLSMIVHNDNGSDLNVFPAKWPGSTYIVTPDGKSCQAFAAIGIQAGQLLGRFLRDHKTQLGDRVIDRVNIFNDPRTEPKKKEAEDRWNPADRSEDEQPRSEGGRWSVYYHIGNKPIGFPLVKFPELDIQPPGSPTSPSKASGFKSFWSK